MKVKDLLAELDEIDPEMDVIIELSNCYSPLSAVVIDSVYEPKTKWQSDAFKLKPRCVVLRPIN